MYKFCGKVPKNSTISGTLPLVAGSLALVAKCLKQLQQSQALFEK